jgi:hypothetical protein
MPDARIKLATPAHTYSIGFLPACPIVSAPLLLPLRAERWLLDGIRVRRFGWHVEPGQQRQAGGEYSGRQLTPKTRR